jgi:hypothetical protein
MTVRNVVDAYARRSITINGEYQRGRAWKLDQRKVLVDSVLRGYPLPRFYLSLEETTDPLGNPTTSMQIIDGLQRLLALSEYLEDKWPLLDPTAARNRFPRAIADAPCPWAGLRFSDLPTDLQAQLGGIRLPVVVIERFDSTDELRDLFIRLQAGTALTRQQIRDAWPGAMSTYIERIAGKQTSRGRFEFLSQLDRRGSRRDDGDELDDAFHDGRQTAAQLLRLFRDQQAGIRGASVDARALDELYHSGTDYEPNGQQAQAFERVLEYARRIVEDYAPVTTGGSKAKVSKLRLFALFLTLVELEASPSVRLDAQLSKVGSVFWNAPWPSPANGGRPGRATSGSTIEWTKGWFLEQVVTTAGLAHLDPRRAFNDREKDVLWQRADGVCELCQAPMTRGDEDYDHIEPWVFGGPTSIENGRAVHRSCNRRRSLIEPTAA